MTSCWLCDFETDVDDVASLAQKVKNLQSLAGITARRAWTAHCANYHDVKDPARHSSASLKAFLDRFVVVHASFATGGISDQRST